MVNGINVSHRARRKVRGALHEETIYGPTHKPDRTENSVRLRPWAKDWIEDAQQFVYRKPLESLTLAMIDDIRDETIKEIVIARLKQFGLSPGEKKKIPAEVWKEPLEMPSGVPIKKVRLLKSDLTIQSIRDGKAFVKPGSIHHVCFFEFTDERGRSKRDAIFVSMLEATTRIRSEQPVLQRIHPEHPNARFVMSLSMGETVQLRHVQTDDLYCFETAASTSKQMWFKHHTAGGKAAEKLGVVSKMPGTFEGRKVAVDVLGRIRHAND